MYNIGLSYCQVLIMPRAKKSATSVVYSRRELLAAAFAATRVLGPEPANSNNTEIRFEYFKSIRAKTAEFATGRELLTEQDFVDSEAAVAALLTDRTVRLVQGNNKETPFQRNALDFLAETDYNTDRMSFAIYVPGMYQSLLKRQARDEQYAIARVTSGFIGEIGSIVEVDIVVTRLREIDQYPNCFFVDATVGENQVRYVVQKDSKTLGNRSTSGTYRATVKDHKINALGIKTTALYRLTKIK